ncbi:MAG TPA: hypothetical protein VHV51_00070 [Polyangiaceae bacterium]|jgi:hypothetical protein|nr:hypothetical protein [Polyangiaceae bacterium]
MAGHRNFSTACVFGLRGVRVAVEDSTPKAIDVSLTMCADRARLRERARRFIEAQGAREAVASNIDVRHVELAHQPASAHVEDIAEGVRIVVVPDAGSDAYVIRDEIKTRVERVTDNTRCD